ncbi:MAG TPA: hypothetical protein VLR27_12915 [Acidimicrobiales bacterium]|nr:hypothetical protein [Acidimicrobiales bacterium]
MNTDFDTLEAELGDRLRHTLRTIADQPVVHDAPPAERHRWRRAAGITAAALIAVGTAAAFMVQNDDAIVELPADRALMTGEAASGEWWLFPTDAVVDGCPSVTDGVVLVAEESNRPGAELNAGGVVYGEPPTSATACAPHDEQSWLEDPSRADVGHSRLGSERSDTPWGVYGTFHPTIRTVRVHPDGAEPFVVDTVAREDRPDGPRFVAFTLLADTKSAGLDLIDANGATVAVIDRSFG